MSAPLALTIIDGLVFLAVVIPFAFLIRHRDAIPKLPRERRPPDRLPLVSIVVPARDESAAVEPAVRSLLAQDHPEIEVVAVDDRSVDGTGDILARIAAGDRRLSVVRVDDLPEGWLGKTHALWRGAERARGEWLLFTDADVVFAPDTVRHAVGYAISEQLDHLTLAPRLIARTLALRAFVAFFGYIFIALWGAYLANDPRSDRGVGIGAFNLLRRDSYERMGTMRALSLRPDDDIRLGRRLRRLAMRQRVLNGNELIAVEWYPSLGAAIRGLEKSMYSSMEYRALDVVAVLGFIAATMVWPYAGVVLLGGIDRWLLAAVIACLSAGITETHRQSMGPLGRDTIAAVVLLPFSALCFAYAAARSMFLAETRGVSWRGTTYPLPVLRAQSGFEGIAAKRRR